ncbi:MAG: hypothetical protein K2N85_10335 [Lachnospiraceae bacterium]|nr:hypothetical protein [Lachnospiraceae bacterium]
MKKVIQIVLVMMVLVCIYRYTKSEATISLAQEPEKEDYAIETDREIENEPLEQIRSTVIGEVEILEKSIQANIEVEGWSRVRTWDLKYPYFSEGGSNSKNSSIYENNKLDIWMGRYGFTDTFEHNSGEINYFVDYEIIIYKDYGKYYAELEGNGWFLQTRSLAYVEGDENSIDIIFKSSLPGDSLYGMVERYEEDELMLTLSYDDSELISSWHVLRKEHPIFIESVEEIKGIYFEKLDESITSPSALPSYRKNL